MTSRKPRPSNKTKALELASKLGVELTEERYGTDGPTIEVFSWEANMHEGDNPYCHTMFAQGPSWNSAWRDAYRYLKSLQKCPDSCSCWRRNDGG